MSIHPGTAAVRHFRDSFDPTLGILSDLIGQECPIFAMPSWFITPDNAQVGYLLSELVRELRGDPPGTAHRSFFANSRYEALHGVIKLMRHRMLATVGRHGGRVHVFDPDGTLVRRADPLGAGPEHALVPGLVFSRTPQELTVALDDESYCGLVIREPHRLDTEVLATLAARCRASGVLISLELADFDVCAPAQPQVAAVRPELVVFGESLTGCEVPFGAFTGTHDIFAPWTGGKAFLHSNTYGGNTVAMRRVRETLLPRWDATSPVRRVVEDTEDTEDDWDRILDLYARHVNAQTVQLHRSVRGALHVVRARGSRLTVRLDSGHRLDVVDGLCGAGLGINGHNPPDAITDVIRRHDPDRDYVGELEEVLGRETGLPHCFPAVSGASAVESALTLAALARPDQRRIVVFRHNYGGKTLVSLLATAADSTRSPFAPLYQDVVYIDPFASDAADRFRAEVSDGQVGLVWVELVHGSSETYAPIPDALLEVVAQERTPRGYLVGVDEILTSYYRCGRRFAHEGRLPEIDLMTLSKALSYGCFPTGAALVSDAVRTAATAANPQLVDELHTAHANQLGAHFAGHAVAQVDALRLAERAATLSRIVQEGLDALVSDSRTVGRRFAEGLLGRLEIRTPRLLRRLLKAEGDALGRMMLLWWITRARVFIVYDVFLLPLTATEQEIRHVMRQTDRLARTGPYALIAHVALTLAEESVRGVLRRRRAASGGPTTRRFT